MPSSRAPSAFSSFLGSFPFVTSRPRFSSSSSLFPRAMPMNAKTSGHVKSSRASSGRAITRRRARKRSAVAFSASSVRPGLKCGVSQPLEMWEDFQWRGTDMGDGNGSSDRGECARYKDEGQDRRSNVQEIICGAHLRPPPHSTNSSRSLPTYTAGPLPTSLSYPAPSAASTTSHSAHGANRNVWSSTSTCAAGSTTTLAEDTA